MEKKKKKLKNQAKIKKRKNFLPTLILALIFAAALVWLVINQNPANLWLIAAFFLLLFFTVFLLLALILANSRRGFLLSLGLIGFLLLRYYQLANYLNLSLFFGILLCLEIYFRSEN